MAGLKDFFRSRSKSRPPKTETVDKGKGPEMPPPPPPPPPEDDEPAPGPLPLMRPDSGLVRPKDTGPSEIGGGAYETLSEGEPPTKGTYPLHGNARAQIPPDVNAPSINRYESFREGPAPQRGTYPLHGNASSRAPSETRSNRSSRVLERSSSKASTLGRRQSGVRAPSSHRASIPPGTAVSTDEAVTRRFSFNSANHDAPFSAANREAVPPENVYSDTTAKPTPVRVSDRQPVQTIVQEWHKDEGPKQLEDAPAVPTVPGQFKGVGSEQTNGVATTTSAATNGATTGISGTTAAAAAGVAGVAGAGAATAAVAGRSIHNRVTSVASSKASSSSRTPIADEFASTSWYGRESSPTAPSWSHVHDGEASTNPLRNQSLDQDRSAPGTSAGQPPPQPPSDAPAPSASAPSQPPAEPFRQAQPTSTAPVEGPPPSRGRKMNRSIDRQLPIPAELRDAPWNRPEAAAIISPLHPDGDVAGERSLNGTSTVGESSASAGPLGSFSGLRNALPGQDRGVASDATSTSLNASSPTTDRTIPPRRGHYRDFSKPLAADGASDSTALNGAVDLRNTEDVTTETRYNPAVVHETVKPTVKNIREEQITREIHNHTYHHRILPIVDVQVLPAKHFVPAPNGSGGFVEVPAESIPGRTKDAHNNQNWVIAETISRGKQPAPLTEEQLAERRRFTARTFEGTEGDHKEWIGDDGVKRQETTWIHPPEIAQVPIEKGLTVPLVIDDGPLKPQAQAQTQTQTQPSEPTSTTQNATIAATKAMHSTEGQTSTTSS